MKKAKTLIALSAALTLGLPMAYAQAAYAPTPQPHTYEGVHYMSGGVGVEGRQAMREMAPHYNLFVEFATRPRGDYVANVDVTVHNAHGGIVLKAVSEGPWFYADLAPGKYKVLARIDGHTEAHWVQIHRGHRGHVVVTWPAADLAPRG